MLKVLIFALALAECEAETDNAWVNRQCRDTVDIPAWNRCVENANDKVAARHAAEEVRQDREEILIAPMLLNRPVQTSCMNIGGIVTCTSR
jgi:hypothetical protein